MGPKSRRAVQLAVQLGAGTVFGHPLGRTGPAAGAAAAPGDGVVAAPVSELAAQVEAVLEELGFSYARPWSAAARAAAPP